MDLYLARKKIENFVEEFENLYGKEHMSFNVHILLHACDCVSRWGPLWAYSAYGFEDSNGRLGKLFNGTQSVDLQVASKFIKIQNLKAKGIHLITDSENEVINNLVQILLGDIPKLKRHVTMNNCSFFGSGKKSLILNDEMLVLQNKVMSDHGYNFPGDVMFKRFEKMCSMKDIFSIRSHKLSTRRQNCYVTTTYGEIHELQSFYLPLSSTALLGECLIFSRRLSIRKIISSLPMHIIEIVGTGTLVLLSIKTIKCKCIVLKREPLLTLAVLSNLVDRD